ncbi:unannotated protein [freshwater metagenome]|uniref:Unannotated protein n=1 Tax=freshwater metagenome TaxID=449393 RepID=A0A6J7A8B0_9ZZZZ
MLVEVGCPRRRAGGAAVLHRCSHQAERNTVGRFQILHVPVGHRLRVVDNFECGLHHCPLTGEVGEAYSPVGERSGGERLAHNRGSLVAVVGERLVVRETRVVNAIRTADHAAHIGPVAHRLQAGQRDVAVVLGLVAGDQWVPRRRVQRRRRHRLAHLQCERDRSGLGPHPDTQQRDVDGDGLTSAFAVEQRPHDSTGDRHRPDRVAECGTRRRGDDVGLGAHDTRGNPCTCPEAQ